MSSTFLRIKPAEAGGSGYGELVFLLQEQSYWPGSIKADTQIRRDHMTKSPDMPKWLMSLWMLLQSSSESKVRDGQLSSAKNDSQPERSVPCITCIMSYLLLPCIVSCYLKVHWISISVKMSTLSSNLTATKRAEHLDFLQLNWVWIKSDF